MTDIAGSGEPHISLRLRWRAVSPVAAPVIAVVSALALTGLLLLALGVDPLFAYKSMVLGAVGSAQSFSDTLAKMVPIALIALGVGLSFQCGLYNVGGEGQFYAGATAAALTGILIDAPAGILIPLEVLAGGVAGSLVALVPATLKAKFNTNEILVTLMLNFVPLLIALYVIAGPFSQGLAAKTVDINESGELGWVVVGNLRLHAGLLFVLVAVIVLDFTVRRTTFGFRVRAIGSNIRAAQAVGINVVRTQFAAFLISGALGGLSGTIQVLAIHHNLLEGMSSGFGFTAVVAALLGRLRPWGILLGSFAFAALLVGGDSMQRTARIENSTVFVIEGLILLFLLAGRLVGRESVQIA
jgi:general nucleoside transport system permease protein